MAGILVTRHLRHLIRTSAGGRVCARPITIGLYWLYQQDIQGPALENATQIEPGTDEPITGVYGGDAVAFAHWVNSIVGSETVYRLPNLAEIEDSAVQRAVTPLTAETPARSIWLESDSGHGQPELWTPMGIDHPHRIDAATLARHTNDDIERSTPTLTRLLLLRSITTVRVFARVLDLGDRDLVLARVLARDLGLDLARVLDLALALDRDLARVLDLALALDRDLARVLALDLALALALDRDLARVLDLARDRVLDRVLARIFALDLDRNLALDRNLDLDRVLDLVFDLASVLDLALDRDLAGVLDLALDRDLALALDRDVALVRDVALDRVLDRVMGSALSRALTRVLNQGTSTSTASVEFSRALAVETGIAGATYVVSPW